MDDFERPYREICAQFPHQKFYRSKNNSPISVPPNKAFFLRTFSILHDPPYSQTFLSIIIIIVTAAEPPFPPFFSFTLSFPMYAFFVFSFFRPESRALSSFRSSCLYNHNHPSIVHAESHSIVIERDRASDGEAWSPVRSPLQLAGNASESFGKKARSPINVSLVIQYDDQYT